MAATWEDSCKYLYAPKNADKSSDFAGKKMAWLPVPGDEGFARIEILKQEGDDCQINLVDTNEKRTVNINECQPMNPPKFEMCTDMSLLSYLNEGGLLHNLKSRYISNVIYTYSGLFCVAVNPYKRFPIYTDIVIANYRGKKRTELPPHVFAIADNAYSDMIQNRENQSILITGESGAGKTENTKKVIQYFASIGAAAGAAKDGEKKMSVEDQVVMCNPVLEAYGNAKTVRNDNSSRFGKFIRVHFGKDAKLASADIEYYLLEKARLTYQNPEERNFHIFYQIFKGTPKEMQTSEFLLDPDANNYKFLSNGDVEVPSQDDVELWKENEEAMVILNFTDEEKYSILKLMSACLLFGNINLKQNKRDEGCEIENPVFIEKTAALLQIPAAEFQKCLLKPRVKVGSEMVTKSQNSEQVYFATKALCKAIFERVFKWLIGKCNKALDTKKPRANFCGVLDIAGFEIFDFNTFEQLCINLTNERLQQFFNHHMFILEQEEYKKEGIVWQFIDFGLDLERSIELMEKPMGILPMLDEECMFPKATDNTYKDKVIQQHNKKHPKFSTPSMKSIKGMDNPPHFNIHHYAGVVGYNVGDWLTKNADPLNDNCLDLFRKSAMPFMAELFADCVPAGPKERKKTFQTMAMMHRKSLNSLMGMLNATYPHFIRCLVPNETKTPGKVQAELILHQLRCNGVLEGIRIVRAGFPNRIAYADFVQRYKILAASAIPAGFIEAKEASQLIITHLELTDDQAKFGNTKVFFRAGILGKLEDLRDEKITEILSAFQALTRGWIARKIYKKLMEQRVGVVVLQRNIRQHFVLRNWPWWKLFTKVKPLLSIARQEDEIREKEEEMKKAMEEAAATAVAKKELEEKYEKLEEERMKIQAELERERQAAIDAEELVFKLEGKQQELEEENNELIDRIEEEEENNFIVAENKRGVESELVGVQEELAALGERLKNAGGDIQGKEAELKEKVNELTRKDEEIKKLDTKLNDTAKRLGETESMLAAAQEKGQRLDKEKKRVESELGETKVDLDKEKRAKADLDKNLRKKDAECKEVVGQLDDMTRQKTECEDTVRRKESEISNLQAAVEAEQNNVTKCQRQIKDLGQKNKDIEDELDNERNQKQRLEKARNELEAQIAAYEDQIEEAGGANSAATELCRRREEEIAKLRKDKEGAELEAQEQADAAKRKFNDCQNQLEDAEDMLRKYKAKAEKEKKAFMSEMNDLNEQIDNLAKAKATADKNAGGLDASLAEANARIAALEASLRELTDKYNKLVKDNNSTVGRLEEAEAREANLAKQKKVLSAQIDDLKNQLEDESAQKNQLINQLRAATADLSAARDDLEIINAEKNDLGRNLSNAQNEIQSWKSRLEAEALPKIDELEAEKRKLLARIQEAEDRADEAMSKCNNLDKMRTRLMHELEDSGVELERTRSELAALDKKCKKIDMIVLEWKSKYDSASSHVESLTLELQKSNTDVLNMKSTCEEYTVTIENHTRTLKKYEADIRDLNAELEGGRNSHELEKIRRKLEGENDELRQHIDELEILVSSSESKCTKLTLEIATIRNSYERQLADADEEGEKARKGLLRQVEQLKMQLEDQEKAKADILKVKKNLEIEVGNLNEDLGNADKTIAALNANIGKHQKTVQEMTMALDEAHRALDDHKTALVRSDKRCSELTHIKEELEGNLDGADRARRNAEGEKSEMAAHIADLERQIATISNQKRKAEVDLAGLRESLEEFESQAMSAEEKVKRHADMVSKLQSDLTREADARAGFERVNAKLNSDIFTLNARIEEVESSARSAAKNKISQMEIKIRQLENDCSSEAKARGDAQHALKNLDRVIREKEFNSDEDMKTIQRLQGQIEFQNNKMKALRRTIDDGEAQIAVMQNKLRKAIHDVEEAEERSAMLETQLVRGGRSGGSSSTRITTRRVYSSSIGPSTTIRRSSVTQSSNAPAAE